MRSKRDTSSISSPQSIRSDPRSNTRISIRSGSISTVHPSIAESDWDDPLAEFPLPGVAPLLPPPRSSARLARKSSVETPQQLKVDTVIEEPPINEPTIEEENEDGPLYILQPRTYTPQPPEPLPSPLVRDSPTSPPGPEPQRQSVLPQTAPQKHTSIRQRVSLRGPPPQDIRIPSRNTLERPGSRASPAFMSPRASNNIQIRDSSSSNNLYVRDSAGSSHLQVRDSSGSEADPYRQHNLPRVASYADLPIRPPLMQAPNSDYQHYHPVRASPHSPLQQRPHTAAGPQANRPSTYFPNQVRNQPSRLGGMSTLSTISSGTHGARTANPTTPSVAGSRTVKKKKSAFGWFKKAFTMDEEERAAFEARKQMQNPDAYYSSKSPKFLDGKRMR